MRKIFEKAKKSGSAASSAGGNWTFFTNHSHVLLCLARDGELTLREVALKVGITERAVQRIVADLEEAEILTRQRDGRRNRYQVHDHHALRHPVEAHCSIRDLLDLVGTETGESGKLRGDE